MTDVPLADPSPPETLLAVDPGRAKCGLAVVIGPEQEGRSPRCLERAVVGTERLTLAVADIFRRLPEITQDSPGQRHE